MERLIIRSSHPHNSSHKELKTSSLKRGSTFGWRKSATRCSISLNFLWSTGIALNARQSWYICISTNCQQEDSNYAPPNSLLSAAVKHDTSMAKVGWANMELKWQATTTRTEIKCFEKAQSIRAHNFHSYLGIGLIPHTQPLDNIIL